MLLMLVAALPAAFAYNFESVGIYYDITGSNTVAVTYATGSYNSYSGNVTIPSTVTYNGTTYTVTAIGNNAFRNCSGLTGVNIPGTVTSIGDNAFNSCSLLASVAIPNGVETIGADAFAYAGLISVTIPNSMREIGNGAFSHESYLTTLHFNADSCIFMGGVSEYSDVYYYSSCFYSCENFHHLVIGNNVKIIPNNAFLNCTGLDSVYIPNSVILIGKSAFQSCSNLTYLRLSNSLLDIGNSAFAYCSSITTVTIPASVSNVGLNVFSSCTNLSSLSVESDNSTYDSRNNCNAIIHTYTNTLVQGCKNTILPNTIKKIGDYAFAGCAGLTGVLSIPFSVKAIGHYAFNGCSGLNGSLIIPDSVSKIGDYAFGGCFNISSLTIGKSVDTIGDGAFANLGDISVNFNADSCVMTGSTWYETYPFVNTHINSLNISNNVKYIPNNSFCYSGLTGMLVIPNSVKVIGNEAFEGCIGLTSQLVLPDSLTHIGYEAFSGCNGLTGALTIPESVTYIGNSAFSGCSGLTSVAFNADSCLTDVDESTYNGDVIFSGCSGITSVHIGDNTQIIPARLFDGIYNVDSITIPHSVSSIGMSAFGTVSSVTFNADSCTNMGTPIYTGYVYPVFNSNLTSLKIGNNVKIIPADAFKGTGITGTLIIPDSVKVIGDRAFEDCNNLDTVKIGNSVNTIGNYAFSNCGIKALTFGSSVTTIDAAAFYNCSELTGTLLIPNSVKVINNYAFRNCYGIDSLIIGKSVNTMGGYIFDNCTDLTYIEFNADSCENTPSSYGYVFYGCNNTISLLIGDNVKTIPNGLFVSAGIAGTIVIPDSVVSIGSRAYLGCSSIDTLIVGRGVKTIGNEAFKNCTGLKHVAFNADSCTSMGSYSLGHYAVFYNCTNTTSLTIGENVKHIPAYAFNGLNHITGTLIIPNSVISIGSYAFNACSGYTSLILGSSVDTIGQMAFPSSIASIYSFKEIPPAIDKTTSYQSFYSVNRNTPVYVPCGSAQAYRNAWTYSSTNTNSYFYYIYETIQPFTFSAISEDTLKGTVQVTTQPTCTEPAVIEATPNFFYVFDHWSDGNTDNPRTVALTQDTTLVAYFREYTLTIIPPSDTALGQVVVLQEPTAENPQAVVSVIPNRCYSFGSWASPANDWDPISYDNPMTLTLTQDTTIRAYFNSKVQVDITKSSDYICEGDSIIVTASGAESYMWTKAHWDYIEGRIIDDDTLGISDSIALTEGGYHYRVIGTDSTGCQGYYGLFSIDVYVYPPIIIAGKTEICEGHSTTLTVSSGEDYELTESLTNGIPYDWTISNNLQLYDLGGNHGNAIMFPAYNLPENSSGELLIPNVNLGFYDRRLTFDVAYRSYYWNCNEQLRVFISTVEDTSWVEVYSKTGNQLSNYNLNDSFYPDDSQWKHQSINLSNLFVNGNAKIKFVFSGGQGNNLWIDDIRVYSPYAEYFPYQYQWSNGSADRQQTFDSAGVYSVTVSDYICSSTDSVTVTVWQPDTIELTVDATTTSYTLNGETFCTSGDYTQILQNIHGCDSVVNLHLNILSDTTVIYDTLCAGSKMIEQMYMSPDEYQQMLMQWEYQFGDSLPFELSYDTITNILTAKGVFISIFVQWEMGYNEYGYPTYNYFDTTLYLNYNVWKDSAYYDDFSYTITYPSSAGCDSTVTWHRKILFSDNAEYIVTACGYHVWQGDSLFGLNGNTGDYQIFHAGDTLTQPGDYAQVYKCKNGCDSVILFHLNFIPASYEELSATACDSYTWNGITYTESGDYTMNSDTTFAVVRELYYENSAYFTWGYDDADGNFISFLPRGWNYWQVHEEYDAETGNYTYNYYYTDQYGVEHLYNPGDVVPYIDTVSGCKSATLHLTINPSVTNLVEATACDSYTWNDSTYTTSGEYMQTFTAANGCDSVVTLYLTVNESKHTDTAAGSCGSYTWNDETYTTSGEYTQTFTAANGCDSVVTLHLTILPLPTPNIIGVTTVCEGQTATLTATGGVSYLWEDGTTTNTYPATVSGFYTVTATNAEGCSATASATVTVNPLPEVVITGNTYICPGGSTILTATGAATYMWSNGSSNASIPVNTFGQYSVIGTSAEGCFSTASITVLVSQPPVITINGNTNLCAGESTTLTATGGVSYMWSNGSTDSAIAVNTAGNWQVIGYNDNNCSNMASVTVNVWQPASSDLYITAFDSCYMWFGTPRCESGNYTYTLQTIHGCDSVITLHLTLEDAITTEFNATSCDSYTWNGATYTVSGNYTQSFTAVNGNDSIVTLHLTVNNPVHTAFTAESCGAYDWNGQTYTVSGDYTYEHLDANGCTQVDTLHLTIFNPMHTAVTVESCGAYDWNGLTYTVSGDYTYEHLDANGCTQVDTLHLTIFNPVHTAVTAENCGYYDWNGQTYTESGDYTQTLTAANGCDSVVTLHLTVHPSVSSDFSVECPDSCYTWNSETYCTSGDYTQTFQTVHGCDSVVTLHLTITVGIDDHNLAASMTVYPNPTTGIVNVQCTMNNVQVETMEILVYDAFGRLLCTTDGVETQNFASLQTDTHGASVQTQIDLSRYAPGVYLIKAVADGNVVAVRKIVKN